MSQSSLVDNGPPFQSLYRRFRPQRFGEVRGQEHVTNTLRNAVATNRVAHAYLFSGPRGTGKTSTARILAKALNCEHLEDGEPCGRCDSCLSIAAGSSYDVHELDAASNNGVDAMRDLVARASLASPGRWKVYIVDEVHMLSTAASNALLKTLEEPPGHVVFVLATTDPQKVLLTIRSRTQQFEFHLLNEEVLEALLCDVATNADLSLPEGAIEVARRRAKGSARDALSLLDQVAAAGVVADDSDALARIVASLACDDTAQVIDALDEALHNGRDPYQVAIELVERLRSGFLRLVAPSARTTADNVVTRAEAAEAETLGAPRCVRAMELIGAAIVAMRDAPDPRITLEVALIRLTHPEAEADTDSILDRLDRLERRITTLSAGVRETPGEPARPNGQPAPPAAAPVETPAGLTRPTLGAFAADSSEPPPPARTRAATEDDTKASSAPVQPSAQSSAGTMPDRDAIVTAWGDQLLVSLRPKVRAIYQAGRFVGTEGQKAVLALPNAAHISHAEPLRAEVEKVLALHFGCAIGLSLVADGPQFASTPSLAADRSQAAETTESVDEAEVEPSVEEIVDLDSDGAKDPKLGLAWAEDRLMEAFPGAQEVVE